MSYHELHGSKDWKWQRRRLEILEKANWRCEYCGESDREAHVHHVHYVKGRQLWEYDDNWLLALCDRCHREKHEGEQALIPVLRMALRNVPGPRMVQEARRLMGEAMENIEYEFAE